MYSATHHTRREDAIKIGSGALFRDFVPTIHGEGPDRDTIWVSDLAAFRAIKQGAATCWNEDQTEITLTLPVRHKFSIRFMEETEAKTKTALNALRSAEIASAELCHGQDPANACWETLREIRAAIALLEDER